MSKASNGDYAAQSEVAFALLHGNGVNRDAAQGFKLLLELANKLKSVDPYDTRELYGNIANELGIIYLEGRIVKKITPRLASGSLKRAKSAISVRFLRSEECTKTVTAFRKINREQMHCSDGVMISNPAVCKTLGRTDDCRELTTFRRFRDEWLINQPDGRELIDEYYRTAPIIVERIDRRNDADEIYHSIENDYLEPCLHFIDEKNFIACKEKYMLMVRALKKSYL